MMDDDEPPTRPDRSLGVFEQACREAIAALESLGVAQLPDDDEGHRLLAEARDLVTVFQHWSGGRSPANPDRVSAIDRALTLHHETSVYLVQRRRDVLG